ncbi:carbohydrate ABC transporter permease [Microbispora bryophytorum]|uniref:Sugar ABC transporter permease n=2 Tax=Microbispora bryophytorum TaxID=1460882 RepID=A0A8H9GUJ5_9ACTN|nr:MULTISPECIES: carbohydrate ABC transporter permease [Microbispora]MBD3138925.1 carbohydrate ABC transporter permease [Microbispora bryophytorum]MBD3145304.1 carbohydrate ABC transporter permease [Microbispora camponoti]TQS10177.1 carbohydrate ABC transporter permease [Microbispora bryophytorum]GGO00944.1 sugar ABC transporter permease [Microbispora bryophytorum]
MRTTRPRSGDRVRWWAYALLALAAFACLFPLYWMFIVATTDTATAIKLPPEIVPGGNFFHLAGLVFSTVPFVRSIVNSLVVAGTIGVGQAVLCALAGFAFAKMRFRGRDALFLFVVLTMTVPTQLAIVPQYMIISALNWVDTLQALIVPGLANAFGIFWMRQHISSAISDEILQAARIDGASTWQTFWHIAFPLVRPAAFVLGLLGFVTAWNDFLWPFVVLKSPEMYTVQIAIKALQNSFNIDLGLAMSGSFLATLPLLVLFVFVGRRMVAGIMNGAFKG